MLGDIGSISLQHPPARGRQWAFMRQGWLKDIHEKLEVYSLYQG